MNLFDLAIKIAVDATEAAKGIEGVKDKASKAGAGIKKSLATAGKVGAAAIGAISTAAVGATAALAKGISDTAAYGDNIDKMSQKMGLSATAYQEWDAIMQHSGTSIESLQAGMKTLANAVESGNDAFSRLGISQQEIASMNQEELFSATISALQNVEDETERTYLAGQLLGRGATELGALLNMSAEETEDMRQRVHELGGVMSDEAVKSAATFQDNLQDLKTSISGIKRGITQEFLPGVNDMLAGFTSLIIGEDGAEEKLSSGMDSIFQNVQNIVPRITEIITTIGNALIGAAPQILNVGLEIVSSLAKSLSDNADVLIDAAFELINVLVEQLSNPEGLLTLIDAAFAIVSKLAAGLGENLPVLIPAVIQIVLDIVNRLTDPESINMLINAAIQLIKGLYLGIQAMYPVLIKSAPEILTNIVIGIIGALGQMVAAGPDIILSLIDGILSQFDSLLTNGKEIIAEIGAGIKAKIDDAKEWGKNLIGGFIKGILEKWEALKGKVTGIVDKIKGLFTGKKGFDERSPSKWAKKVFEYVLEGGEEGFDEQLPETVKTTKRSIAAIQDVMTDNIEPPMIADDYYYDDRIPRVNDNSTQIIALLNEYLPVIPMLANMKVIMDSGATVGALAPGMDANFGRRLTYAERGNA
jgi:phage-related protein